jgi:hypothetical protein
MTATLATLFCVLAVATDEKPKSRVPLGKETTYVNGPIDKDGYIDYEAAVNERMSKGISPDTNANVLLFKAFGPKPEGGDMPPEFFKQLGIPVPPEKGDYFVGLGKYAGAHLKLNAEEQEDLWMQQSRASARPWKAEDLPHITAWLTLNEKPLAIVVEATKRPHYFNPMVSFRKDGKPTGLLNCLLPNVQKCRELCNALCARAMLRLQEGKTADAWQDLIACHRLGRHIAHGMTLIESLVGIAVDAIASNATLAYLENAKLSSAEIIKHMKDLQALPAMPLMSHKIADGERFFFLDSVQMIRRGGPKTLAGLGVGPVPKEDNPQAQQILENLDWEPVLRNANRWYDRIGEALRGKTRAEREKAADTLEEELKKLKSDVADPDDLIGRILQGKQPIDKVIAKKIGDILIGLLMPAIRKVQSASDRCEQIERNVQIAFALAAFHKDNKRYPAKLEDLAPKYLAAVPDDIFSGKALKYRPLENAYLLYSVGANGKDEEGRWYDDDPPGDDPRVIMPLPELKIRR